MTVSAKSGHAEPIAIIGLGGIFPGSTTVRGFLRNVLAKRCFIRDLPDGLWEHDVFFSEDRGATNRTYSDIAGLLGQVNLDVTGLRIPPTVALRMSRSQKLALLCAREALTDAGLLEQNLDRERTAVFMAAVPGGDASEASELTTLSERIKARLRETARDGCERLDLEMLLNRLDERFPLPPITEDTLPGESAGIVAGRIASTFNLNGPNLSLESACASTLAAVNLSANALRTGECDTIITGGVETATGIEAFIKFSKIQALSSHGAYVFDQRADGFVIGEGCGIFVLRRWSDAVRDGNRIYALIRGCGGASDGAGKGISAPDSAGQLRALERAYQQAGVDPRQLHFVECHGTGTQVGDVTELDALGRLLAAAGAQPAPGEELPVGSCKAMIGHLRVAAGAAGLFRSLTAVHGRMVPPQVNCEWPTTAVDWAARGLRVPQLPEGEAPPPAAQVTEAPGLRCLRFERLNSRRVADLPEVSVDYRCRVHGNGLVQTRGGHLDGLQALSDDLGRDRVVPRILASTATELCRETIPEILRLCADLDADPDLERPFTLHLVTLAAEEDFQESSYRALCALAKSLEKDLTGTRHPATRRETLASNSG